jgi:hypothetical protein
MSVQYSVVLRLDPAAMENPEIDVRWGIEKALHAADPGVAFTDDGYGFARHSDAMLLAYATDNADRLLRALLSVLETHTILGNRLASAAMIAVAQREEAFEAGEELANHKVVYPPERAGEALPD